MGVLPGGAEMHAALVAPTDEYLAAHPGDWVGAFHVMLGVISNGQADLEDPAVKLMEANAEAALRGGRAGEVRPWTARFCYVAVQG